MRQIDQKYPQPSTRPTPQTVPWNLSKNVYPTSSSNPCHITRHSVALPEARRAHAYLRTLKKLLDFAYRPCPAHFVSSVLLCFKNMLRYYINPIVNVYRNTEARRHPLSEREPKCFDKAQRTDAIDLPLTVPWGSLKGAFLARVSSDAYSKE